MVEQIGIVGGGQLGRMLTEAAQPLGFRVNVLDPNENCPAAQVGARQIIGELNDQQALTALANESDVVTWEIEHINAACLSELAATGHDIQPSPQTLSIIQDKYNQKTLMENARLPVAHSVALNDYDPNLPRQAVMDDVIRRLGGAVILKTRTGGYDGRGNMVYDDNLDLVEQTLGTEWNGLYAEQMVNFDAELAVIAARDRWGHIVTYPPVETTHENNICQQVVYPAQVRRELLTDAQDLAHETLEQLDGAGVFAIEMFALDNLLLINEIAPRVHNSGHLTIEASVTSQFEQHIRAITGMPLGSTTMRSPAAAMINILGSRTEPLSRKGLNRVLAMPDVHPHFYGKSARAARKIGHITVLGSSAAKVQQIAKQAREELEI